MNIFDRAVSAVSPERGLKRMAARKKMEVLNSGYSNYGANHTKKSIMGWNYAGGSSREDIEDNLPTLRQRSRDLYMGVPLATSAIKTYRTNVIGSGLSLKPKIDCEALGISEEQGEKLTKQIYREWNLWADSTDCDAARLSNFYELQQLAFINWLLSGDALALLQSWKRKRSVYDLRINLVEADRCSTPPDKERPDGRIIDGVEMNSRGEVVAYHICNRHPLGRQGVERKWVRVSAYGAQTGRRNVLHLMNRERIGQCRGVPLLAPVIESLKQLGRYTEAELIAAVINGYLTVFIEKSNENGGNPVGEVVREDEQIDQRDDTTIEMGPGVMIDLSEGEKANAVTPGRPNSNFEGFFNAISREIGAALEQPQELIMRHFSSNYSASRGALLEAWKAFDMFRDWMVSGFCEPIYQEWFAEAVAKGRIQAPGFWNDPAIRRAYAGSEWYGPSRGQLDPKKEVEAAEMRVKNGFSTATKEAMELTGTDFQDNMAQIKRENRMKQEAGLTGQEQSIAAPAETERENEEEEEEP